MLSGVILPTATNRVKAFQALFTHNNKDRWLVLDRCPYYPTGNTFEVKRRKSIKKKWRENHLNNKTNITSAL